MFNRVVTFIMALTMFGFVYGAGYYNGFQHGQKAGADQCITEVKYTLVEVMADHIMLKESSLQHVGVWGKLPEDQKYPAYGIAQFQKRTFYWMAKLAGLKDPNWKDQSQQEWLLKWALVNGYGHHWGKNYRQALQVAVSNILQT